MTGYGVSGSISVEFAPVEPDDVARELRDGDVHAEADAEVRDAPLARDRHARILPSQPREPKPPGHEHAVDALEQLGRLVDRTCPRRPPSARRTAQPCSSPACLSASWTER